MQITKDSIVSITYQLADSSGKVLEQTDEPISYLHGGYDNIFPTVEAELQGKSIGESLTITLQPEYAFGEYDAELVRVESKDRFPVPDVQVGMQFEGESDDGQDMLLYTVTEITDDTIVVDGNHPLAGQTLKFTCTVTDVRPASAEEIAHGHAHGEHGHHHH
ncbi:MAG: FKBP-type peptidyl-prolyl cis-trans isomerase [Burkholderiales bacterium]